MQASSSAAQQSHINSSSTTNKIVDRLRAGIKYESEKGYINWQGTNQQFSAFLQEQLAHVSSTTVTESHPPDTRRGSPPTPPGNGTQITLTQLQAMAHQYPSMHVSERIRILEEITRMLDAIQHNTASTISQISSVNTRHVEEAEEKATKNDMLGVSSQKISPAPAPAPNPMTPITAIPTTITIPTPTIPSPPPITTSPTPRQSLLSTMPPPPPDSYLSSHTWLTPDSSSSSLNTPFLPPAAPSSYIPSGDAVQWVPILFDCETHDRWPKTAHPVEIAAKSLLSGAQFDTLVRLPPGISMDPGAVKVTGITTQDVIDPRLPDFRTAYSSFLQFIMNEVDQFGRGRAVPLLIGHNIKAFDIPMLMHRARAMNLPLPRGAHISDTLFAARQSLQGKLDSFTLGSVYRHYTKQDPTGSHRAMSDVLTNETVFRMLLNDSLGIQDEESFLGFFRESLSLPHPFSSGWVGHLPSVSARSTGTGSSTGSTSSRAAKGQSAVISASQFGLNADIKYDTFPSLDTPHGAENKRNSSDTTHEEYSHDIFSAEAWASDDPLSMIESGASTLHTRIDSTLHQEGGGISSVGGFGNVHADWQQLVQNPLMTRCLLVAPVNEVGSGSKQYTAKQLKDLEAAGLTRLLDVLECFPKGYLAAQIGLLPQQDIQHEQPVCLMVRLDDVKVSLGPTWANMNVILSVVGQSPASIDATDSDTNDHDSNNSLPHNDMQRAENRRVRLIHRVFRQGRSARWAISNEEANIRRHSGGGTFAVIGRVEPTTGGRWGPDTWQLKDGAEFLPADAALNGDVAVRVAYSRRGSVSSSQLNALTNKALRIVREAPPGQLNDPLPESVRRRYRLPGFVEALEGMHAPKSSSEYEQCRRRLAFQELFCLQLKLLLQRAALRSSGSSSKSSNADSPNENTIMRESNDIITITGNSNSTKPTIDNDDVSITPTPTTRDASTINNNLLFSSQQGICVAMTADNENDMYRLARSSLPYVLTNSQERALSRIGEEMSRWPAMMCLLQGDVGCGKTIVAFLSVIAAVGSGYQCAVMAPTSILAEQHYKGLAAFIDAMKKTHDENVDDGSSNSSDNTHDDDINDTNSGRSSIATQKKRFPTIALLTGSTRRAERTEILAGLADGSIDVVLGTHALVSDPVSFHRLGLAVIDEQHKFGVQQRAKLLAKASPSPHILSMTATPIPRSLALVLHGELTLVTIDEVPPGRSPVDTHVMEDSKESRSELYGHIRREIGDGGQVYIVCPMVDGTTPSSSSSSSSSPMSDLKAAVLERERLIEEGELQASQCGVLHGRMTPDEKEAALAAFKSGKVPVLISTTVVEVGVDVSAASMMVVEHADRFGLAQLHQLRGRVGRGSRASTCYLISDKTGGELQRLRVLERSSSGFDVAEADFKIRGAGEVLGKKQSGREGVGGMKVCELPRDAALVEQAREAAALHIVEYGGRPDGWSKELLSYVVDPKMLDLDLAELPKNMGLTVDETDDE